MTSLDTPATPPPRSLAERAVDAITTRLSRRPVSRRRFLTRATVVASALAVDPVRYALRPGSAYASVCGEAASCSGGWTAFCCTINDGANTCPEGSYAAGWWKIDASSFCRGAPRYIIDCNRLPSASCSCTCADGECDERRVCCNVFRYGQCNQHVPGVTEVVCRVVTCTVPWEWDEACTDTVRTDNRTATHTATCLPGTDPTWIEIKYQDIGLAGSIVGRPTRAERDVPGGRRADYEHGLIAWSEDTGAHALDRAIARRYVDADATRGDLGFPVTDAEALGDERGRAATFVGGSIWWTRETGARMLTGPIHDRYARDGGATGWLGYPTTEIEDVDGPWRRVVTDEDWAVVHQTERDEVRVLPADVDLPADGSWPAMVEVERWHGADRVATAVAVAEAAWPDGASRAVIASAVQFPDALTGGVVAARRDGPLLLTDPSRLPDALGSALDRLGVDDVVVLGGPDAVSDEVLDAIGARVRRVRRWAGPDRYATAVDISRRLFPRGADVVHVATGEDFADALAGVPAAVDADGPVLLTATGHLPEQVAEELRRLRPTTIVVAGGPAAVSEQVVDRLRELAREVERRAGSDRFGTAAELSAAWTQDREVDTVVVASGQDFPDGLGVGAVAGRAGAPVLLSLQREVPDVTWREYRRLAPRRVVLVGGTAALSSSVQRHLAALPVAAEDDAPDDGPTDEPTNEPTDEPTEGSTEDSSGAAAAAGTTG